MFQLFTRAKTPAQNAAASTDTRAADALRKAQERLRPRIFKEDYGYPISVGARYREFVEATLRRNSLEDPFRVVLAADLSGSMFLNYGAPKMTESARLSLPGTANRDVVLLVAAALGITLHRNLAARLANHDRRDMLALRDDLAEYRREFRRYVAEDRFCFVAETLGPDYTDEARKAVAEFRARACE